MVPFLAALAVISVVLIAIVLFNLIEGSDPTDEQQIGLAAVAQNDALQRENFADFRANTCGDEVGTETDFLDAQRKSVAEHGARYIDGVTAVTVDGERAHATVTYHFANDPDDKTGVSTTFVREAGAGGGDPVWKVCSTGQN